jgi:hypothetical protein
VSHARSLGRSSRWNPREGSSREVARRRRTDGAGGFPNRGATRPAPEGTRRSQRADRLFGGEIARPALPLQAVVQLDEIALAHGDEPELAEGVHQESRRGIESVRPDVLAERAVPEVAPHSVERRDLVLAAVEHEERLAPVDREIRRDGEGFLVAAVAAPFEHRGAARIELDHPPPPRIERVERSVRVEDEPRRIRRSETGQLGTIQDALHPERHGSTRGRSRSIGGEAWACIGNASVAGSVRKRNRRCE